MNPETSQPKPEKTAKEVSEQVGRIGEMLINRANRLVDTDPYALKNTNVGRKAKLESEPDSLKYTSKKLFGLGDTRSATVERGDYTNGGGPKQYYLSRWDSSPLRMAKSAYWRGIRDMSDGARGYRVETPSYLDPNKADVVGHVFDDSKIDYDPDLKKAEAITYAARDLSAMRNELAKREIIQQNQVPNHQ